jgi:esterase/lipase
MQNDILSRIIIIGHGLNNSPSVMNDIKDALYSPCTHLLPLNLTGHDSIDSLNNPKKSLEDFRKIQASDWLKDLHETLDSAYKLSKSLNIPIYFIGYSLSSLLFEYAVHKLNLQIPVSKVVHIGPALFIKWQTKLIRYIPLPKHFMIPSLNRATYRAHKGTTIAAYTALFDLQSNWQSKSPSLYSTTTPRLVFLSKKDELIDFSKTNHFINAQSSSNWKLKEISRGPDGDHSLHNHLSTNRKSLGHSSFNSLICDIKSFLQP